MAKLDWDRASNWRKTRNGIIDKQPGIPQVNKSIIKFGKYRGYHLRDVPQKYLEWVILNMQDHQLHSVWLDEWQRRHTQNT